MALPALTLTLRSFAGGEIAPELGARMDQVKYQTGLATCRNWFARKNGSVSNRSGTAWLCPLYGFQSLYARGIPFEFNNQQAYDLVLSPFRIQFMRDGAPILYPAVPIGSVTQANPPVIYTGGPAHAYGTGDLIYISGCTGMTQLNGRFFTVTYIDATHYSLKEEANVDATGYTAYSAGGSSQLVYSIASPYAGADLAAIRYKQSGDTMVLVHEDYAPQKLLRISDTNWTIANASFIPAISAPANVAGTGTAGATVVRYRVTSVSSDTGEESFGYINTNITTFDAIAAQPFKLTTAVAHGLVTGDEFYVKTGPPIPPFSIIAGVKYTITVTSATTFTLDGTITFVTTSYPGAFLGYKYALRIPAITFPSAANPINLTWNAVSTAIEYNVYREANGIYAYVGTAGTTSFQDLGYSVNISNTPPIDFDLFSLSGYPGAVGFWQQRLTLGGFKLDKERVRCSRSGLFFNFTRSNPTQDDDAISFVPATGKVNGVKHLVELERMLDFTQGSVISIEGDQAGTLLPSAITPRVRSSNGCGQVPPLEVGTTLLYAEFETNVVNELIPNQPGQALTVRDVTVYSPHLFEGRSIVDWCWSAKPFGVAWACRDDGVMLGFTYLREQELWGWHRHDTGTVTGDKFVGVMSIPERGESAVYSLVKRYSVNGQTRIYVERMASRLVLYPCDGRFLDSFVVNENANLVGGNTYRLAYDTGYATPTTARWYLRATGTTPLWTVGDLSPDIGRVILIRGAAGERLWCTVNQINSTTEAFISVAGDNADWIDATGGPNSGLNALGVRNETAPFPLVLPFTTSTWSQSTTTVTNLWHLEGRTVQGLGDGYALADMVVANGSVTLPAPAVIVVVGIPIIADLQTLEQDTDQGETWADKSKTMSQITVKVHRALGLSIGLDNKSLQDFESGWCRDDTYRPGELFTGALTVINKGRIDDSGQMFIRQAKPLAATVLGIYPRIQIGDA